MSHKTAYLVYSENDAAFVNAVKNTVATNLNYLQDKATGQAGVYLPDLLKGLLEQINQPQQNVSGLINRADIVLAFLSPEALGDEKFVLNYNYLQQCNKPVILIIIKNCLPQKIADNFYPVDFSNQDEKAAYSLLLKYINMLPVASRNSGGQTGFQNFTKQNNSGNFDPGNNSDGIKTMFDQIKNYVDNPGSKEYNIDKQNTDLSGNSNLQEPAYTDYSQTTNDDNQDSVGNLQDLLGSLIAGATAESTSSSPSSTDNLNTLLKGLFDNNNATQKVTGINTPAAVKGKILYDIPDTMQLHKQEKCIIRIGKDEITVKSGDVFSETVVTDDIKLSGLMKVELIDIANIPNFSIKTISTPIQEVDDDEFTEWLFYVTPVNAGLFSLIIKVSAIKNEAGREKIKDIVFEKNISINTSKAESSFTAMAFAAPFSTTIKSEQKKQLRDIMNEPAAKYMESPDVFISYAHDDRSYFEIFEKNLRSQSGWNIWTDRNIQIGANWFNQIQQSMTVCNIAVLLISANFFSSAFIKEHEYRKLKEIQDNNPAVIIIPVLLRDVDISRWEDLTAIQFFSAHYYEYGLASDSKTLLPFAMLCEFDKTGLLIPNAFIDTYFKNLVQKVQNDWLRNKLPAVS